MEEKKSLLLKSEWQAILCMFLRKRALNIDGVQKLDLNLMDQIELLNNSLFQCLADL